MNSLVLSAIDGANPLGFLAALGALRIAESVWPRNGVRLRWIREGGWRPELTDIDAESADQLCERLAGSGRWAPLEAFENLGNNITVEAERFAAAVARAVDGSGAEDRRASDFAAAFGCEVCDDPEKGRIEYTDLCFITGSGHQHFLGTARGLPGAATAEHLREALFGPWTRGNKGLSFRWDPDDAKEYALRWRDPSVGGVWSVWGANRLAFEALPLFPALPTERGLRTTGFRTAKDRGHEFTWPIWSQWASVDTVRSLVALNSIQQDDPDRAELRGMGIEEVFRALRVRIGQGANFKVSFRPARSV
jgi:hypothetical protein